MDESCGSSSTWSCNSASDVEGARSSCRAVRDRIQSLPLSKITDSCKRTLLKLVDSELRFLSSLFLTKHFSAPISVNVGYIESVVHILQQPFVTGVSRVCKPVSFPSLHGKKWNSCSKGVYVDIVCTIDGSPAWFIVSDRNPKYITWLGSHRNKGLKTRVEKVLKTAFAELILRPSSVIFFFSNGLNEVVAERLRDDFGASDFGSKFSLNFNGFPVEGDWVYLLARSSKPLAFQINVCDGEKRILSSDHTMRDPIIGASELNLSENQGLQCASEEFCSLVLTVRSPFAKGEVGKLNEVVGENLINFDTTALIGLVSGISNGGADKLLVASETDMRSRFKDNVEFVMAQAKWELQSPILAIFSGFISGKRGIICESVQSEFRELLSMYGGPKENARADQLLARLLVTPDSPSERLMSIPTTRKISVKNKIIFGTGDYWHAPTLTANAGFVRAISQTGMSLQTLEHKPRALVGD